METLIVKVFASEMACRIIDMAMQVHSGMGYSKELRWSARTGTPGSDPIRECPTENQKSLIARSFAARWPASA